MVDHSRIDLVVLEAPSIPYASTPDLFFCSLNSSEKIDVADKAHWCHAPREKLGRPGKQGDKSKAGREVVD